MSSHTPEILEALKTTLGNIKSLGPAGVLGPFETYRPWMEMVEEAIAKLELAEKPKRRRKAGAA